MVKAFAEGIVLADGTPCRKAEMQIISDNVASVKICEGKYHQIKRMLEAVNNKITYLERNRGVIRETVRNGT